MANTGKQSPLGINVLGSLLQNEGLCINPVAQSYMGENKSTEGSYNPGKIVNDTCLKWLTYAINDAFTRGAASQDDPSSPTGSYTVNAQTYNNLLNIGQNYIPALGNSPPPTWETNDPSGVWKNQDTSAYSEEQAGAPANSGYGFYNLYGPPDYTLPPPYINKKAAYTNQGQNASWYPFLCVLPDNSVVPNKEITKWGWIRCIALQAWNEFNYNGKSVEQLDNTPVGSPEYKNFIDNFASAYNFINYSNKATYAIQNSLSFLKGTYSNQNDLMSGDISGVSLSSRSFGQDLINAGNAFDLRLISKFGLPSTLLQTLQKNNALTQPVILALLAAELSQSQIENISNGSVTPTKIQEQKIYSAFTVISGSDLKTILITLNVKTKNLFLLSDLLSVKKLFPLSYTTLTVPIYNISPGPTNSKTYYLLFVQQQLNPQLVSPNIKEIVGTLVPQVEPPPPEIFSPLPVLVQEKINQAPTVPVIKRPEIPVNVVTNNPNVPAPKDPPTTGGGCVVLESYVPLVEKTIKHNNRPIIQAWMLESGMQISVATEDMYVATGIVNKTLNDYQPCVKIITTEGISLVCSTTAQIYTKENGYIPATEVYGKRVAVMRNNSVWYDEVVGLDDVGMKFVRVIDIGNNSFWAGEKLGAYILHHNVIISDTFNYDKN